MTYVADEQPLTACPACGSGRIACTLGVKFDMCVSCLKFWERLPAGEPYTIDGEQLAFDVPCDDCAFRGGSDERADAQRWAQLQESFAHDGQFFCHKAVPFTFDKINHGKVVEFEFPKKPGAVKVDGQQHHYTTWDTDRMRLCRGFLNEWVLGRVPRPRDPT